MLRFSVTIYSELQRERDKISKYSTIKSTDLPRGDKCFFYMKIYRFSEKSIGRSSEVKSPNLLLIMGDLLYKYPWDHKIFWETFSQIVCENLHMFIKYFERKGKDLQTFWEKNYMSPSKKYPTFLWGSINLSWEDVQTLLRDLQLFSGKTSRSSSKTLDYEWSSLDTVKDFQIIWEKIVSLSEISPDFLR